VPSSIIDVAISPDGRTALFSREQPDLGTFDIWQVDLARGTETRVTSDPETEFGPVWLPDGKSIVYSIVRNGKPPNLVHRSYPGEREEPLLPSDSFQESQDITPDGRQLVFWSRSGSGRSGLSTLSLAGGASPVPFLPSPFIQDEVRFSQDGRSVALISNESGHREAYVVSLGPGKERVRLSTGGAESLRWSRNGKEIYYTSPDRKLYAVPVTASPTLQAGTPSLLFPLPAGGWTTFDVAADGRFLAAVREVSGDTAPLSVVSNALSGIRR
jgi:Tol biopolymer transport system component